MVKAIYPGSFDPMTYGHLDIIQRSVKLFDQVIVAVVGNPGKSPLLPVEIRAKLIRDTIAGLNGVVVKDFQGLTVELCQRK